MGQVDWHIVKDVFYTALNRSAEERADFLRSACGENNALRSEVEFLLESYESGFLESPILADASASALADKPLFEQGQQFSHYQILRLIGRGGMGEVYLADDLALDRLCAIKVIHRDSGFGEQAADRLIREARSAAKLDHPNICSVYEVGEVEGEPYIAMQYVEGEMLDSIIARDPIELMDAVSYTRQIAAALSKSHSWGIVHRDIKPSNIIVDANGQVKVLDFGLAKATHVDVSDINLSTVGLIAGTVTYMSPEHARGQEINGQTDVWSLGVVFFQLLTGRLPFRGENKADLISSILNDDVDLPSELPAEINYILGRALEKDREKRYPSIEEFESDLNEFAETGSVKRSLGYNFRDRSRTTESTSLPIAQSNGIFSRYTLMAALLFIVFGSGFGLWWYRAANAPRQPFSSAANMQTTTVYDLKRYVNGAVFSLSFSPDGTQIAYGLTRPGSHVIYVQSLTGEGPVPVTSANAISYSNVWSPDGQRIGYISIANGRSSIWSVTTSGVDAVRLCDLGAYVSGQGLIKWSNDGTGIFVEDDGGISKVDLATGVVSRLDMAGIEGNPVSNVAISPDESRFLMATHLDGKLKLWVKSLYFNDARRLSEDLKFDGTLEWLHDNQRFVYASDESGTSHIYIRSVDESTARQITFGTSNIGGPAVSPDGTRLLVVDSTNEANLFATDVETGRETVITSKTDMQLLPAFSPDGLQIAFGTAGDESGFARGTMKIAAFDRNDGSQPVSFGRPGCCAEWSPNGEEIFYLASTGGARHIWKFGARDQRETQVTLGEVQWTENSISPVNLNHQPFDVSPNGANLVFSSKRTGQGNLWTVSADGTGETQLTYFSDGKTKAVNPLWSPDNRRVAFVEVVGTGSRVTTTDFRVAIYDKGNLTTIGQFNKLATLLAWSADGRGVYVSLKSEQGVEIYLIAADGTAVQLKATLPNAREFGIKISRDERWIVFTARRDEIDNLYLVSIDGGEPRRVTENNDTTQYYSGVTWSPDSRTLLYSKQTGGLQISLISDIQEEGH